MEVFYVAVLLIVLGVLLIAVEITTPGFFLAIPGGVFIVYGVLLLAFPWLLGVWWGPWLLAVLSIPVTLFVVFMYRRLAPPEKPVTTTKDTLVGKEGIVVERVRPHDISGKVRLGTEVWSATCPEDEGEIPPGTKVVVVDVNGVHLIVRRVRK